MPNNVGIGEEGNHIEYDSSPDKERNIATIMGCIKGSKRRKVVAAMFGLLPLAVLTGVMIEAVSAASIAPERLDNSSYWAERESILALEQTQILGQETVLTSAEESANGYLMKLKKNELQEAFDSVTVDFPPANNFMTVIDKIEASDIFKFIQKMPKGAGLHLHEIALWSVDLVVAELTYWDDLYMCTFPDGMLMFRFFDSPNSECEWELVADARAAAESPQSFDANLFSKMSLMTENPHDTYPNVNVVWRAFEKTFGTLSGLIYYRKAWEIYLYEALREFHEDNVQYIEFRGTLSHLYEKNGTELDDVETLTVYRDVAQRYANDHPGEFFGAKFIYAPIRKVDVNTVEDYLDIAVTVKKALPDFIAGFDLVGQEDLGLPLKDFIDPLLSVADMGVDLKVFYHSGETNWMGMDTDENIIDALLLNASRIGHGYAIVKHPKAKQLALEKNVPIEVCPISNQVLHLVSDLRNHPVAGLVSEGFPIVISADDPAAWGAKGLSYDFYEAFMALGGAHADLRFLKQLAINSINYSTLSDPLKEELMMMWQKKWDDFINSYGGINSYGENLVKSVQKNTNKFLQTTPMSPQETERTLKLVAEDNMVIT